MCTSNQPQHGERSDGSKYILRRFPRPGPEHITPAGCPLLGSLSGVWISAEMVAVNSEDDGSRWAVKRKNPLGKIQVQYSARTAGWGPPLAKEKQEHVPSVTQLHNALALFAPQDGAKRHAAWMMEPGSKHDTIITRMAVVAGGQPPSPSLSTSHPETTQLCNVMSAVRLFLVHGSTVRK